MDTATQERYISDFIKDLRSVPDLDLLRLHWEMCNSALGDWLDTGDVAYSIAVTRTVYDRGLRGPGRRVLPEFEAWRDAVEAMRAPAVVVVYDNLRGDEL